jgi:hypothetical protein
MIKKKQKYTMHFEKIVDEKHNYYFQFVEPIFLLVSTIIILLIIGFN